MLYKKVYNYNFSCVKKALFVLVTTGSEPYSHIYTQEGSIRSGSSFYFTSGEETLSGDRPGSCRDVSNKWAFQNMSSVYKYIYIWMWALLVLSCRGILCFFFLWDLLNHLSCYSRTLLSVSSCKICLCRDEVILKSKSRHIEAPSANSLLVFVFAASDTEWKRMVERFNVCTLVGRCMLVIECLNSKWSASPCLSLDLLNYITLWFEGVAAITTAAPCQ